MLKIPISLFNGKPHEIVPGSTKEFSFKLPETSFPSYNYLFEFFNEVERLYGLKPNGVDIILVRHKDGRHLRVECQTFNTIDTFDHLLIRLWKE